MASAEEMQTGISEALARLEALEPDSELPPAVIVFPTDSEKVVVGNTGGFLRLALAALKAAQGEYQSFEGAYWIRDEDPDWTIAGLEPNPEAHLFQPAKQSRWQTLIAFIVVFLLGICFIVGVMGVFTWTTHLLRAL